MDAMMETVTEYEAVVVALKDPTVIETAMRLSYYTAMVDAATHDPLDEPDEQEQMLTIFQAKIQEETEKFQELVNDLL